MSNDSDKFHARAELENAGFTLAGNAFVRGDERYLPLYEAKMIHHYNHRYNTFADVSGERLFNVKAFAPEMTEEELRNPNSFPLPRYWVDAREVEARLSGNDTDWLIGFRAITNVTTNRRTAIFCVLPPSAVGHTMPLYFVTDAQPHKVSAFLANHSAFVFDYVVRQKVGGTNLAYFHLKQSPVIPPHSYTSALLDFIRPRVLELTYTAWDLRAFARDLGYEGAPFVWDEARRFRLRCELDALYFHLYGMARGDVEYIMDTFPIVRRKDEAAYGEFRTKRVILEMYDAMARLPSMTVPAPKDAGSRYAVPDVSGWQDFDRRGAEGAEER